MWRRGLVVPVCVRLLRPAVLQIGHVPFPRSTHQTDVRFSRIRFGAVAP